MIFGCSPGDCAGGGKLESTTLSLNWAPWHHMQKLVAMWTLTSESTKTRVSLPDWLLLGKSLARSQHSNYHELY